MHMQSVVRSRCVAWLDFSEEVAWLSNEIDVLNGGNTSVLSRKIRLAVEKGNPYIVEKEFSKFLRVMEAEIGLVSEPSRARLQASLFRCELKFPPDVRRVVERSRLSDALGVSLEQLRQLPTMKVHEQPKKRAPSALESFKREVKAGTDLSSLARRASVVALGKRPQIRKEIFSLLVSAGIGEDELLELLRSRPLGRLAAEFVVNCRKQETKLNLKLVQIGCGAKLRKLAVENILAASPDVSCLVRLAPYSVAAKKALKCKSRGASDEKIIRVADEVLSDSDVLPGDIVKSFMVIFSVVGEKRLMKFLDSPKLGVLAARAVTYQNKQNKQLSIAVLERRTLKECWSRAIRNLLALKPGLSSLLELAELAPRSTGIASALWRQVDKVSEEEVLQVVSRMLASEEEGCCDEERKKIYYGLLSKVGEQSLLRFLEDPHLDKLAAKVITRQHKNNETLNFSVIENEDLKGYRGAAAKNIRALNPPFSVLFRLAWLTPTSELTIKAVKEQMLEHLFSPGDIELALSAAPCSATENHRRMLRSLGIKPG